MNLSLRPHTTYPSGPVEFQVLSVEVCDRAPSLCDMSNTDALCQDSTYIDSDGDGDPMSEPYLERISRPCEVCVFGVTTQGHSVAVRVDGFMPHFFVEVTSSVTRNVVTLGIQSLQRRFNFKSNEIRVEFVHRKRMYGWVPAVNDPMSVRSFTFARLSFVNTYLMRTVSMMLSRGEVFEGADISESRVDASEKFLAAHNLKASGWARLHNFTMVESELRATVSQLEVRCRMGEMCPMDCNTIAPLVIASMDIEAQSHDYRSFPSASHPDDPVTFIGTTFWVYGDSRPRERIMQVLGSCDTPDHNGGDGGDGCDSGVGVRVFSYATEYELLVGWRDLIAVHANPDFVVSYNGTGFDYAYLSARMVLIRETTHARLRGCRFNYMSRLLLVPNALKTRELTSSAKGQNMLSWFPQPGRVQMDLFMYVKDSYKLSSYKLDDVSAKFLPSARKVVLDHPGWVRDCLDRAATHMRNVAQTWGGENEVSVCLDEAYATCPFSGGGDEGAYLVCNAAVRRAIAACTSNIPLQHQNAVRDGFDREVQPVLDASGDNNYRKLFRLYDAGPAARAAIAVYGQVDCDLLVLLMDRLNVVANVIQMSQVCNTLADDVCNRGQQIKTYNLISRFANARNYVMNVRETGWDPEAVYEGATVLDPHLGYYQVPVATLDFASLYPSLMCGYNLCHSSLVLDDAYTNLEGVKYGRYDIAGRTWTFQESTPGLLPEILTSLLEARRDKKREMKKYAKSSFEYRLCDGAQLALKVSCNSVYGFCGVATNGMYPCMPVAVATTFNGRRAINMTKTFMEETYNATVVYGDTDSVMVTFPGISTVEEAFPLAARAAAEATAIFPDAIVLEFEKIFFPYLLVKKKTYAGMKYEDDPNATPTLDVKGLAVVRRDNCELVRDVMREILEKTMHARDPMAAYDAVVRVVDDVLAGRVPLAKLQISNSLRNLESYTNTAQPQLTVVQKMRERHAFDIPRSGDRVPYIICHHPNLPRVSDRAEHPSYVEEHNIMIDKEYYLVSQLQKRLEVITDPLPVPDIAALFQVAVSKVRDAQVDQEAISKLCRTVSRTRTSDAPKLASRTVKRKRGGGWDKTDIPLKLLPMQSSPSFVARPSRVVAKKRSKGFDVKAADVGVPSLMGFMIKKKA